MIRETIIYMLEAQLFNFTADRALLEKPLILNSNYLTM